MGKLAKFVNNPLPGDPELVLLLFDLRVFCRVVDVGHSVVRVRVSGSRARTKIILATHGLGRTKEQEGNNRPHQIAVAWRIEEV